jgi:hypothetical protein
VEYSLNNNGLQALNAICPYYTMFPLTFPLSVLEGRTAPRDWVLDPFCGRGTTNFAARLLGLPSVGVDTSRVAVALTQAKLADATVHEVVDAAKRVLGKIRPRAAVPTGEFWRRAFHRSVLEPLCRLREALLENCRSDARILLRAILLGALHGPRTKQEPSHLSNQCPRTYAPKPDYAVRFWKKHRLVPPESDIIDVVRRRAERYLTDRPLRTRAAVYHTDSRLRARFGRRKFRWIITSPPYYGMRTYVPDQWLRDWFLGGPAHVVYRPPADELSHRSSAEFVSQLTSVWRNVRCVSTDDALLVVRFGGISDRKADPNDLIRQSLRGAGWRLISVRDAGTASNGKRQAEQFQRPGRGPVTEFDYYAHAAE